MAIGKGPVKVVPKVIYGIDNRLDVYQSSDFFMNELVRSTAVQIDNNHFVENEVGDLVLVSRKLMDLTWGYTKICLNERFLNQPIAGDCSGFLVAPDVLVTAGHCISHEAQCENHFWVFDYANTEKEKSSFIFSSSQVVRCERIIERQRDRETGLDYAVLKLERAVTDRKPLEFRKSGKVDDKSVLTVLGYPMGLPAKITPAGDIRENQNPHYFVTNTDSYSGNSGSPVVDSHTGIVEGILVRGDSDYVRSSRGCMTSSIHSPDSGRGEDVVRINVLESLSY